MSNTQDSTFNFQGRTATVCVAVLGLATVGMLPRRAQAVEQVSTLPVVILDVDTHTSYGSRWWLEPAAVRTTWRYWETWQTEVIRTSGGELVRADPFKAFNVVRDPDGGKTAQLRTTNNVIGSPFPVNGWQQPDFDDSAWFRHDVAMNEGYRSLALMSVRGKFEVTDPGKTQDLTLTVAFQGGIVAYLNGKEIGRANMPKGAISNDTFAEDYPIGAFVHKDGVIPGVNQKDPDLQGGYALAVRRSE